MAVSMQLQIYSSTKEYPLRLFNAIAEEASPSGGKVLTQQVFLHHYLAVLISFYFLCFYLYPPIHASYHMLTFPHFYFPFILPLPPLPKKGYPVNTFPPFGLSLKCHPSESTFLFGYKIHPSVIALV